MIHIHFVTEPEGNKWILRRWVEEWVKYLPGATIDTCVNVYADVNVFCNYALYSPGVTKKISIFTHREKHDEELQLIFDIAAENSDWCFAQSLITLSYLPPSRSSLLRPSVGAGFFSPGKLRLGIVGRNYPTGRKNFHWIDSLKDMLGEKIDFIFTDGLVPYDMMPEFYRNIDYLLITANNEGGPIPLVEALAMKKPVIAPKNVGWCDEFSTIKYDGTLMGLVNVLEGLVIPRDGWEVGASKIYKVAESLLNGDSKAMD